MSEMCMGSEKGKLSLKSDLLLGALALVLIVGLSTGVYAASAKDTDKELSSLTFNPFTLQSLSGTENVSGAIGDQSHIMILGQIINTPPRIIHIPFRPVCRSPYKLELVNNRTISHSVFRPALVLR